MVEILIGCISGIISGTGTGGGTILILILSLFMGINQHTAQATNLMFFIPTAITATIVNMKNKKIEWRIAKLVIISGIIGSLIGSKLGVILHSQSLKKYFGIFLTLIGIYEIYSLIKTHISENKKT